MQRFPLLGLLSSTWGFKEIVPEKFPSIDLEPLQALYVYGLRGYDEVSGWLKMQSDRRLIFLEEDPDFINAFLQEPKAKEIIADPQVHIAWIQNDADLDVLAEMFPFPKIKIVALASKRGKKFNQIRLKLLRKTTMSQSLRLDRVQGDQLFANFVQNISHLPRSFYVNALKGAFAGLPAIVCGAGPSLDTKLLKQLQGNALLIAGGSTIAALTSQGITPHFGMAVDPNPEEGTRFQNVVAPTMPLLYSTRVFPDVLKGHRGPLGYMRSGIGGAVELWVEEQLHLQEPLLAHLASDESISVTMICLALAETLGCNPILLNGIDLAYTNNQRYAPGVIAEVEHPSSTAADERVRRKSQGGKQVETAVRWVMESDSISHFAKQYPDVRFINTTTGGLKVKGIECMPLNQAPLLASARNLYAEVAAKIEPAPKLSVPDLTELHTSLERVIDDLRILAGEKKGSKALAEVELQQELAVAILFHGVIPDLALAVRYNLVFMQFISERPNADA